MSLAELAKGTRDNLIKTIKAKIPIEYHTVAIGEIDPKAHFLAVAHLIKLRMSDGTQRLWMPLTSEGFTVLKLKVNGNEKDYFLEKNGWVNLGSGHGSITFDIAPGEIEY